MALSDWGNFQLLAEIGLAKCHKMWESCVKNSGSPIFSRKIWEQTDKNIDSLGSLRRKPRYVWPLCRRRFLQLQIYVIIIITAWQTAVTFREKHDREKWNTFNRKTFPTSFFCRHELRGDSNLPEMSPQRNYILIPLFSCPFQCCTISIHIW